MFYPFQTSSCMLYHTEGNGLIVINYGTSVVSNRELTVWGLLNTTDTALFRGWAVGRLGG